MKEGDVVLAQVPQADRQPKNRPAIVLREMPPFRDFLVCGISSRLHLRVESFDELISPDDVDFPSSGLLSPSLVRLGFLTVLSRKSVLGSIGSIAPERHQRLLRTLSGHLVADLAS